ncbi:MAG: ATP-binding cassette domain-containing protein, partial [Oscillospiraceae bacterium]|nr:ATP-binding cassette domain-containing protein [Oscillospiraceae bacterium]
VGRIGSGKTTLMTLLCRFYNLPAGTVFIDGKDIMECGLASVRKNVAFVPKSEVAFLSLSAIIPSSENRFPASVISVRSSLKTSDSSLFVFFPLCPGICIRSVPLSAYEIR